MCNYLHFLAYFGAGTEAFSDTGIEKGIAFSRYIVKALSLVVSVEKDKLGRMALPMTVRLIQEFLEGASAKSTLQRYFPASEPDMSWIRRSAKRIAQR